MADDVHTLTPSQRAQLRALLRAGATSRDTAMRGQTLGVYSLSLLGVLQVYELVSSRSTQGYLFWWLTAAGIEHARQPQGAPNG